MGRYYLKTYAYVPFVLYTKGGMCHVAAIIFSALIMWILVYYAMSYNSSLNSTIRTMNKSGCRRSFTDVISAMDTNGCDNAVPYVSAIDMLGQILTPHYLKSVAWNSMWGDPCQGNFWHG